MEDPLGLDFSRKRGKAGIFQSWQIFLRALLHFVLAHILEKKRVKKIFGSCGNLARFNSDEPALFVVPNSLKRKRIKKSLRKVKIFLDKILFCDTLSLVEKCAPIQSGRFAFMARFLPRICNGRQRIPASILTCTENKELIARSCGRVPQTQEPSCPLIKT